MADPRWGRIANSELDQRRVKGVYFFAGDWRSSYNPVLFYEDFPNGPNDNCYTVHPADGRHLGWSVNPANRKFAVDEMHRAGANVVIMSYWGERGTDRWRYWAPMQTSTQAHDELFDAAIGQSLLIMPAIESGGATPKSREFTFAKEFPPADPASSQLVVQIEDLLRRYVIAPQKSQWPGRWLRLYDQDGQSRLAIHIIQVRSTFLAAHEHERFAAGFDAVANYIEGRFKDQGIRIGFTIDAQVRPVINGSVPGNEQNVYYPIAADAGGTLRKQKSLLAIQGFIPEISLSPERSEADRLAVKRTYFADWMAKGIPVLMDLTPGYDGHLVFPPPPLGRSGIYGNNGWWRRELLALIPDRFTGVVYNTWNGYTEGYAAVATTEFGEENFGWLQRVFRKWSDINGWFQIQPGSRVTALWRELNVQLDLFVTGLDGQVWTTWWEPFRNWGYWAPVNPNPPEVRMQSGATVSAVWREARKHLDLFVSGTDGTIWSIWWSDQQPGWRPDGWLSIHSETKMKPGATVTALWREPGKHLDLFATATDGTVSSIWWNDVDGWRPGGWLSIHAEIKMKPGATVTALWREPGKHLDLFATATDGTVSSIWWNDVDGWRPGGWLFIHPEIKMKPGTTVTALWREPGKHLDLFATATDGTVSSIWWNDVDGWRPGGWLSIHSEIKMAAGTPVTAVWRESGKHLDLFTTATDGTVWSIWWNDIQGWRPEGWLAIKDAYQAAVGQPITAVWSIPRLHLDLFAVGKDGRVVTAWWEPDYGW